MEIQTTLTLISLIFILGILFIWIIYWIGTDILHELKHIKFLLKEKLKNKDE